MSILMIHILDGDLYISALDFLFVIGSGVPLDEWQKTDSQLVANCLFSSMERHNLIKVNGNLYP